MDYSLMAGLHFHDKTAGDKMGLLQFYYFNLWAVKLSRQFEC